MKRTVVALAVLTAILVAGAMPVAAGNDNNGKGKDNTPPTAGEVITTPAPDTSGGGLIISTRGRWGYEDI